MDLFFAYFRFQLFLHTSMKRKLILEAKVVSYCIDQRLRT